MFIRESSNHGKKYLSIAKEVKDNNGKWKTKVIAGLGYVNDLKKIYPDPKEFFKDILKKLDEEKELVPENSEIPLEDSESIKNLGYIYIKWFLLELHIDEFFEQKQKMLAVSYNLFEIYSMLVYSQIIHPCSIEMSFIKSCEFFEKVDYELYDVYRALSHFADYCVELQEFIYKQLGVCDSDNMKEIFFDGTNFYYETDKEDPDYLDEEGNIIQKGLRKKGFSKENRPLPIINLGLINNVQGIPLDFNIFSGKDHEKVYIIPLIEFLKTDCNLKNFELTADRGLYSGNVIRFIEDYDRKHPGLPEKYIIGFGIRSGSNDLKDWAIDDSYYNYFLVEHKKKGMDVFKYKIRKVERLIYYTDNDKRKSYRSPQSQLVYYSPSYARKEKYKRLKEIEKAQKMIEQPGTYTAATNSGAAKLVEEVHYNTETGEVVNGRKLRMNEKKIKEQELLDGYYVIVTNNLELNPMQIRYVYRKLKITEDDFKILKSYLKIRPIYLWTPKHVLAHIQILIISLQAIRVLQLVLNKKYHIHEIFEGLRSFNAFHLDDNWFLIPFSTPIIEDLKKLTGIGFTKRLQNKELIVRKLSKKQILDVCKPINIDYS